VGILSHYRKKLIGTASSREFGPSFFQLWTTETHLRGGKARGEQRRKACLRRRESRPISSCPYGTFVSVISKIYPFMCMCRFNGWPTPTRKYLNLVRRLLIQLYVIRHHQQKVEEQSCNALGNCSVNERYLDLDRSPIRNLNREILLVIHIWEQDASGTQPILYNSKY
jgi:hypothetical protein